MLQAGDNVIRIVDKTHVGGIEVLCVILSLCGTLEEVRFINRDQISRVYFRGGVDAVWIINRFELEKKKHLSI